MREKFVQKFLEEKTQIQKDKDEIKIFIEKIRKKRVVHPKLEQEQKKMIFLEIFR